MIQEIANQMARDCFRKRNNRDPINLVGWCFVTEILGEGEQVFLPTAVWIHNSRHNPRNTQ